MKVASPKKTPHPPSREACRLAALLKAEILRNKADYKFTQAQEQTWAVTADRMLRLDNRTYEQIAKVIQWAHRDEFWMQNIHSMAKLREKFDQLEMKAKAKNEVHAAQKLSVDYVPASEEIRREHAAVAR